MPRGAAAEARLNMFGAPRRYMARGAKDSAFWAAVLLSGIVLGAAIAHPQFLPLLLPFAAAGAGAFIFGFPFATVVALFVLTDFIFHARFFTLQLGPLSVEPYHLVLGGLLVVAIVRPRRRAWGGVTGAALAAFLGFVFLAALVAIQAGRTDLFNAFNWGLAFPFLAFFYVVVRLFPEPRDYRPLLAAAAVLAALTGVVASLIALGVSGGLGDYLDYFLTVRQDTELYGDLSRVRLPGLSLAYALFWFVVVELTFARGRERALWALVLLGIGLNIIFSFDRNMWVGLIVGMLLMLALAGAFVRQRLAVALVLIAAALVATGLVGPGLAEQPTLRPIVERGASVLRLGPEAEDLRSTIRVRERESEIAWATAQRHPLTGIGLGADFGVRVQESGFSRPQLYLHNQYLYLLLIGGVPALLFFLLFMGSAVTRAWFGRKPDVTLISCGVGLVLIMLSAVVHIFFSGTDWTIAIGLLAGVVVAGRSGQGA